MKNKLNKDETSMNRGSIFDTYFQVTNGIFIILYLLVFIGIMVIFLSSNLSFRYVIEPPVSFQEFNSITEIKVSKTLTDKEISLIKQEVKNEEITYIYSLEGYDKKIISKTNFLPDSPVQSVIKVNETTQTIKYPFEVEMSSSLFIADRNKSQESYSFIQYHDNNINVIEEELNENELTKLIKNRYELYLDDYSENAFIVRGVVTLIALVPIFIFISFIIAKIIYNRYKSNAFIKQICEVQFGFCKELSSIYFLFIMLLSVMLYLL